jgi:hypothetical protein
MADAKSTAMIGALLGLFVCGLALVEVTAQQFLIGWVYTYALALAFVLKPFDKLIDRTVQHRGNLPILIVFFVLFIWMMIAISRLEEFTIWGFVNAMGGFNLGEGEFGGGYLLCAVVAAAILLQKDTSATHWALFLWACGFVVLIYTEGWPDGKMLQDAIIPHWMLDLLERFIDMLAPKSNLLIIFG